MANRREMDDATFREIGKTAIVAYELVEVILDSGPVRMCNYRVDAYHEGNTFPAVGNFLGFDPVEENAELQVAEVGLSLSGLDPTHLAWFMANDVVDRPVNIWRQLWSEQDGVIGTFVVFRGRIAGRVVRDDGASIAIAVTVANQFVDFERRAGRRTSIGTNDHFHRGDRFFEFAPDVIQDIQWRPYDPQAEAERNVLMQIPDIRVGAYDWRFRVGNERARLEREAARVPERRTAERTRGFDERVAGSRL